MERPRFTRSGREIPAYDPSFVDELIAEGYDYSTALLIAATEIEGANHNELGNIESLQTYCDELDYDEDISGHLEP